MTAVEKLSHLLTKLRGLQLAELRLAARRRQAEDDLARHMLPRRRPDVTARYAARRAHRD